MVPAGKSAPHVSWFTDIPARAPHGAPARHRPANGFAREATAMRKTSDLTLQVRRFGEPDHAGRWNRRLQGVALLLVLCTATVLVLRNASPETMRMMAGEGMLYEDAR